MASNADALQNGHAVVATPNVAAMLCTIQRVALALCPIPFSALCICRALQVRRAPASGPLSSPSPADPFGRRSQLQVRAIVRSWQHIAACALHVRVVHVSP